MCLCCTGATSCGSGLTKDLSGTTNCFSFSRIGYYIIPMQSPSNVFPYLRSRHKALAAWTLAEGIANLGRSIYWARQFGIVGVALGTTVPMLVVRLGIQPFYTLNVLDVRWSEYLSKSSCVLRWSRLVFSV